MRPIRKQTSSSGARNGPVHFLDLVGRVKSIPLRYRNRRMRTTSLNRDMNPDLFYSWNPSIYSREYQECRNNIMEDILGRLELKFELKLKLKYSFHFL